MTDVNKQELSEGKVHQLFNQVHYVWDRSIEPALTIQSGDIVVYDFNDGLDGQIKYGDGLDALINRDQTRRYPLSGPIYIEDAELDDTLEIEVVDLRTKGLGWTCVLPGRGLLSEEFNEPYLRTYDLSNGDYIPFREDIHIPINPFLGTMGVAPGAQGEHPVSTPNVYGGNMDIRHLTKGARLFLPVQVPGALFSAGDGHAAQGDGEICLTAVECPLQGTLRFRLHKHKQLPGPQLITAPGSLNPQTDSKGFFVTTGISKDLFTCAQDAVRAMVKYLQETHQLSRYDAYVLCSLVVDLKISELVNPVYLVSAYLPLSIFR